MTRLIKTIFLSVPLIAGVACGDDDGGSGDDIDAGPGDADASDVDAGEEEPGYNGTLITFESSVHGQPMFGNGLAVLPTIRRDDLTVPPVFEEIPGAPFGCKVYEYTADEFLDPGADVGSIQITYDEGPEMPACNFVDGMGYRCIGMMGAGGDIEVVDADMGLYSLTNDAVTFGTDEVGRFVNVSGADADGNNGMFPIVMADADSITFRGMGVVEELDTAASYMTLAGLPQPSGMMDPIADDATVSVEISGGVIGTVTGEDFMWGDDFTLDDASDAIMSDIPTDGSAFTLGCGGDGGDCNEAMASIANFTTTDGTPGPGNPFPDPEENVVQIICIVVSGEVDISEEVSQYIADSGATVIRSAFVRAFANNLIEPDEYSITFGSGHGILGFTMVPPPK